MTRRFVGLMLALTAVTGVCVGIAVRGVLVPETTSGVVTAPPPPASPQPASTPLPSSPLTVPAAFASSLGLMSFADVAEQVNPAVVSIDAQLPSRRGPPARRGLRGDLDPPPPSERRSDRPRLGAGTGFLIDPVGHILTSHHVVDGAERISVKTTDGRSYRATLVGSDADTDIAVLKIGGERPFAHAQLGDSDDLRVGEWVVAIGNPLAYEHTVTVGVVSFVGRKLFDSSLDDYIQTDAAISFGNSGGPLINARGEVIGINAAVSRQSNHIGFAIPINLARGILPQLKSTGRVTRGYLGTVLRDVDPDLQQSLGLRSASGALVQDVAAGSPGERAGLRPYDVIVGVDEVEIASNEALIREVSARAPGSVARFEVVRDGRSREIAVKLSARPVRNDNQPESTPNGLRLPRPAGAGQLGLSLIQVDAGNAHRFDVPPGMTGLLIQRVEPMSAAHDAGLERGQVLLEVNRRPVQTMTALRHVLEAATASDVLSVYVYLPEVDQRQIRTLRLDPR